MTHTLIFLRLYRSKWISAWPANNRLARMVVLPDQLGLRPSPLLYIARSGHDFGKRISRQFDPGPSLENLSLRMPEVLSVVARHS